MPNPRPKQKEVLDRLQNRGKPELMMSLALANNHVDLYHLIDAIGMDATIQLVLIFGGEKLKLPTAQSLVESLNTTAAAWSVYSEEQTEQEAAAQFKVTVTAIRRVLKTVKAVDDQVEEARQYLQRNKYDHPKIKKGDPKERF